MCYNMIKVSTALYQNHFNINNNDENNNASTLKVEANTFFPQ